MQLSNTTNEELIDEISKRFSEKEASMLAMEEMTKNLLKLNEKNKQS